uniref:Uncharacterized protein n=1 Tax=Arundo donax TaxID=35708 RepID=A0A0A8XUZ1_ARUDO
MRDMKVHHMQPENLVLLLLAIQPHVIPSLVVSIHTNFKSRSQNEENKKV